MANRTQAVDTPLELARRQLFANQDVDLHNLVVFDEASPADQPDDERRVLIDERTPPFCRIVPDQGSQRIV